MTIRMPLIRSVVPNLIAENIINAQPMSIPTQILQTSNEPYNAYPYIAERHILMWDLGFSNTQLASMLQWCEKSLPSSDWHYQAGKFYFRVEAHRTMFVLAFQQ